MPKKLPSSAVPAGLPTPPILVGPEGGGSAGASTIEYDTTYDYISSVQENVAPRADMPGPWFITNFGPNTVYYGPTGVTSGNGTAIGSGAKSASISGVTQTFVICAPGNQSLIHITNS